MGLHTWIPEATGTDDRSATADNMVDIIAVQWLGANPYFTWVRKIRMENNDVKEVMWLRDLLPACIPHARIATFSYPSDWFRYRRGVKKSLRELGEQLLNVLELDRKKCNATHRPIIFIGHSMGGLALVLASNRPEFQNIKSFTAGIVFLGTPHGGTDLAGYASFIAKVKGNDTTLVQSLKSSDENLLVLSQDFAFGYRHLSIMCFYETMQTGYLGGHTKIQEDTDHSGLNKFSGADDPNFKVVRSVIENMVWEIPQMNSVDKKTDKLHQKIDFVKLPVAKGASFDSHIEEHDSKCLANTRVELQRQVKEWAKDRNGKPIFWLNGMAGSEKSTIARAIARLFADEGQLGASFFFKRGDGDRGTASRFLTTIATGLMANVPGLIPGITKAIDADPAISKKTLKDQFEKLVLHPFLEIKRTPPKGLGLIIVIDALDKCEREKDKQVILQLLAQTKGPGPGWLRVFVTSRPELPIRPGFKNMRDGTYQDLTLHDIAKETVEQDLALFLEHELKMVSEEHSPPLGWPSKGQIKALVNMAIPLLIFAATACRYIGDKRDDPRKRLEIVLQYETAKHVSQLDKTYLPILNQLLDDEDGLDIERWTSEFREIVGSIVVLESPLSIGSLANLLNIPKEDASCRLDLLNSVLNIPIDEDMPIRLLHSTFRDFLLDIQKRGKSPFWINEKETHKRLASKCLLLLSSPKGLRQNMCNLTRSGIIRSDIDLISNGLSLEVRYACRYWVHHLEQSGDRICDGDLVHTFLQKHLLYWLEAMSLMGEASESIHIINSQQSLTDLTIFGIRHNGKRFVLRNRSIPEDAPPQLYSPALIFDPEMSIIRTTFDDHIPIWVTRLPKMQKDWNALMQTLGGHSNTVKVVAFLPDGQLVAFASKDDMLRLWDPGTGSCRSRLEGHSDAVSAVAFSPGRPAGSICVEGQNGPALGR
ncbi:hypothetical protein MMC31_005149, partial [Peltigera leucophlebia]|nr:hypothetical protein [Peltigera leucophlebia]